MTNDTATISIKPGSTVIFDGEVYRIPRRVHGPDGQDTYVVEQDGKSAERHIDWFEQQARDSSVVVVENPGGR